MLLIGYLVLFVCTPTLVRMITKINPFEYKSGCNNIQHFNDIVHVCAMIFAENTQKPMAVAVYFLLDILFNLNTFMNNKAYLVHHIVGCFMIFIIYKHLRLYVETLGFLIWIQETALIPISIIDILRLMSIQIPKSLYVSRTLWYISTRVYTYGLFFCYKYDGEDKKTLLLLSTPLLLHNVNVLRLQVKSMLRVFRK